MAEFKDDRTKFNQIVSSGIITSLFLGVGFIALFFFSSGIFAEIFNMPELPGLLKLSSTVFPFALVGSALLGFKRTQGKIEEDKPLYKYNCRCNI